MIMQWLKRKQKEVKKKEGPFYMKGQVKCPDCGSTKFHEGPSGGMSTNIKCAKCGSEFNYTPIFEKLERI